VTADVQRRRAVGQILLLAAALLVLVAIIGSLDDSAQLEARLKLS